MDTPSDTLADGLTLQVGLERIIDEGFGEIKSDEKTET
jgi:hypothetical protein